MHYGGAKGSCRQAAHACTLLLLSLIVGRLARPVGVLIP